MTSDILGTSKSNISTTIARFAWIITYFFPPKVVLYLHCPLPLPDSHLLDHETRKTMETVTTSLSNHLGFLNEEHTQGTESIRSITSDCIEKDYSVSPYVPIHIALI
jgi:hypothetical protein